LSKAKRGVSFLYCAFAYLLAFAAGYAVFHISHDTGILFATFLADIAATVVVWISGVIAKNASLYDPYWSVAPLLILPAWLFLRGTNLGASDILFVIAIYAWGLRLTYNWAVRWEGLAHQDWRYTMLREKNPGMWFVTNLAGINLMPTVLVYMGMAPVYFAVFSERPMGGLTYLGFTVCIGAALLQAVADRQMETFKKSNPDRGRHIDTGLWHVSRHPNYLGEISFWWGIWLMQMGIAPVWATVIGPIAITLLFVFVSIPMMERHVEATRPGYTAYKREVPMLVPFIGRRKAVR
jgi:steroid 5-alpha reductase family enzyme